MHTSIRQCSQQAPTTMDRSICCPNPQCESRKKWFTPKGFAAHLEYFAECSEVVFNPGVASDVSNGPSEKKRAVSISQLFQKKRLCLNPHIADIEKKHQQQHWQQQKQEEDMLKEHDEEDESQHSDSEFGLQHDDNSIVLNESLDDGSNMSTDAANPELYCSNEEEDYDTFTVSQKSVVKLLYLLDQMEAPDYAFQSIMKWASECYQEGFDFNPQQQDT
ncbi:MAG: hypothetical protein MZW92_54480 [Comamonadaceae bacterium]|nr:hypothetical protein [Comamonadaceae bacterium]